MICIPNKAAPKLKKITIKKKEHHIPGINFALIIISMI